MKAPMVYSFLALTAASLIQPVATSLINVITEKENRQEGEFLRFWQHL